MQSIGEPGFEAGKTSSQAHELDQFSMLQRIFSSLTLKRDFQGANGIPVPNSDRGACVPDTSGLGFGLRSLLRSPYFIPVSTLGRIADINPFSLVWRLRLRENKSLDLNYREQDMDKIT